ncbi:hypothetical protein F4677DRAFT_418260 [Hypoxylon crocopeplum]|nr:hypothetical protein F4677DRAFT_418260 [Hypoxylon crocopeplum]
MFASVVTVVAALAASAAALPGAVNARETYATWTATNFEEGCSPGGCIASFNISAPAGYVEGAPAFNVACHPIYIQRGWVECDAISELAAGSSVASLWNDASERELIKISVSHAWLQGEARYNASGSDEFAAGTTTFQVPVTSITAVL